MAYTPHLIMTIKTFGPPFIFAWGFFFGTHHCLQKTQSLSSVFDVIGSKC